MRINLSYIVILVLIIVIILQRSCQRPVEPGKTIVKTEIIYDTIIKTIPTYVPQWKTKIIKNTIVETDTVTIVKDYNDIYVYNDSLVNDTVKFFINDTITQNKIKSRTLNYHLNLPTKIITKEVTVNKRELYYGLGIVGNSNAINFAGGELLYIDKHRQGYGIGIGVDGNFKPSLGAKLYWKL